VSLIVVRYFVHILRS